MRSSLLSAALAMLSLAFPIRGETYDIGGRRQLFIDHRFVADSRGVELSVHPPEKIGPVLASPI